MDSVRAIGSSLLPLQVRSVVNRDAESALFDSWISPAEPDPAPALAATEPGDPAADGQRMLHLISHVDATCFISLLQILDPLPDDYRARAEYKRFYHQLHETLEIPLAPQEPEPVRLPTE